MNPNHFGNALRKRLYPNTPLHPKQLAAAIGMDVQTVYNHMGSRGAPCYQAVSAYISFFCDAGDYFFLTEIFPGVEPLIQRNKRAEEALTFVEGLAKFAQGGAAA